jgi:poly-gamma-glutamate capsule biosynthesis protein CapA/YwtB (metallophosphatase superfamily)
MKKRKRLLGFVGDVLVDRADNPNAGFQLVEPILSQPDVLFGNAECVFHDDPKPAPSAAVVAIAPTRNVTALKFAHFDVMSVANNHIVDAGHEGMDQTINLLNAQGIQTVGAGKTLDEATRAAVLSLGDTKVAYLAYASFFPVGYEARDNWPGLAPMRSHNHYVQKLPNLWAPGADSVCQAVPLREDLDLLQENISQARKTADVVVTSFHWGDYQKPFHLTEHERFFAHTAIEFGADIVVGHHHHVLRGIEWYQNRPIFYGLGHFVFDFGLPRSGPRALVERVTVDPESDDYYGLAEREGWPLHPWHPDARLTAMAWVELDGATIGDVGFVPCRLNPHGEVVPLDARSSEGQEVLAYMQRCCDTQGLDTAIEPGGATVAGFTSAVAKPRESR